MKKKWTPSIRSAGGPKYMALVEALESGIEKGELCPGDRLPSHRELGDMFGVTIATVTKAMTEAARRGIIDARVGSGTFIRERNVEVPAPDVIDLSINTLPPDIVADLLADTIARIPSERLSRDLFNYSSYAISPHHRQLGAAWIAQFCTRARPENLLVTNGVHQGLLAAFGVLLRAGESAICEPLTYTGIKRIAEYRGVKLVGAKCDEEGITPDGLESELRRSEAKVVIITTTTQNPTTATLSEKRRQALAEVCRKSDAWIIEDGVNIPLANDGTPSIADIAPERTIHLTGFSKCVASGFRLGYAVLPEQVFSAFHDALVSTQWTGPGFYSELAASMLANGVMEQCIARHRAEAAARFALAQRLLGGVRKSTLPAYHAWISVPTGWSAEEFAAQAAQMGVRVSPASHFAVSLADLPAAYRISLGACANRALLEEGLTRLATIGSAPSLAYGTVI
ncbi:MAG TPA: PLP-dependent aminotransferase family protein [Noviherbaspirillum sp.]|uniref:aminotransferase-like domain-containing protein n=1 Tax=Noviherbaspirillum sp. TaxID=1926288 RepID=UPI002B49CBCF|nr:PLP-dependent aminotransferase family protein [Noviherbaspirillum sp.]HJV84678.1 PLP-dependent aminotransferase family protein [Noviherbaspirillum sp.]